MGSCPVLLDLCCKAGGAAMGYSLAGFDVVGVDIEPQPNYPFRFYQADALAVSLNGFDGLVFDAVHVSPPCQGYSTLTASHHGAREKHVLLIDVFRQRLQASGLPYVIENVEGAKRFMQNPVMLCANMFGLRTYRHRLFESNVPLQQPFHPDHIVPAAQPGAIAREWEFWSVAGHFGQKERAQREALGIDWMKTPDEMANAIPPIYAQWVGLQIIQALGCKRRALRVQMCECGCGQIARTPTRAGRPGRFAEARCRVRANRALKADVTKFSDTCTYN